MTPSDYLHRAGLADHVDADLVSRHVAAYLEMTETVRTPADAASLFRYRVPELGENGACSLPDQLAAEPYDLAATLGGITPDTTACIATLDRLVAQVQQETGCGWLGVYQARTVVSGPALVKLAYRGKPSRAEFPLTAEFAEHSNNSTVGLSGKGRIIDSVDAYLAEGGVYYTCDAEVQSEACLPLFDEAGAIVGIVDAEDARRGYFSGDVLARVVALCLVAIGSLPD
jgi:putative methionine-R-sulfoxide reductase with GAF domain